MKRFDEVPIGQLQTLVERYQGLLWYLKESDIQSEELQDLVDDCLLAEDCILDTTWMAETILDQL